MTKALTRITYVDDEADIRTVTKLVLERLGGFTVDACTGGQDALARMGEFAPDLVLLDVMMPQMDGPQTLQAMRATPAFAKTPVLFVTARSQAHEIAAYKAMGVVDVITKPFDPAALPQALRSLWKDFHDRKEAR
jgi:CheY-like chemotaxis protein